MLTGESVLPSMAGTMQQAINDAETSIESRTEARLRYLAEHPGEIPRRLDEIGREWTEGRVLTAAAAGLIGIGAALAMTVDKRLAILPAVVAGFMLEHAIMGGGPLSLGFRELGFRRAEDIARERFALKALRGDFERRGDSGSASENWADRARTLLAAACA